MLRCALDKPLRWSGLQWCEKAPARDMYVGEYGVWVHHHPHKPFAAEKVERLDQIQVHGTVSRTYVYGCYNTSNEHDVSRIAGRGLCREGDRAT
jgi:hypothetical protein